MPSTQVELRPNRHLLDHNFDGYKLNLQTLPIHTFQLETLVDRLHPDEIQYSFVHAKLFALHNHLVLDYWDHAYNYYYINKKQQVCNVTFETVNNTFQSAVLFDIPAHVERQSGHFNPCLAFASFNRAVVSDGTGYLHIVDTSARNKPSADKPLWQTLHSSLEAEGKCFIIIDTKAQEKENMEILHCLLQSVEQNDSHFYSLLTWVTFENNGQSWKQSAMRQLKGKGIVHYAALETTCTAMYIASDHPFKFTMDSERKIEIDKIEELRQVIYTWLQTSEDITITLKLQKYFKRELLDVIVTPMSIKISYAGKDVVKGTLRHKVDSELTTWNVQESGQLDILVTKCDSMIWDELIQGGDASGEQIMDASLVEEAHRRLAHLCSETEAQTDELVPGLSTQELEECDAASDEDTVLVRFDSSSHQVTHRAPLSVHQYLFNIKLETHEVPAIVLRHDVDACIWQPYAQVINSEAWPMVHQGTLMAFGYVQSSKQNRKFITSSPNFSYSVVCEATRHIFIYKSAATANCQLRKRAGSTMKSIKVGQQHVVNIEKKGEVVGINATNEYLFVLTESSLVAIQVQSH